MTNGNDTHKYEYVHHGKTLADKENYENFNEGEQGEWAFINQRRYFK